VHSDHQLLLRGAGFALSTQSDTQAVVRLFEIRFQFDRSPKRRDCAAALPSALSSMPRLYCASGSWIDFDSSTEFGEGASVIALAAQRHSSSECADANRGLRRRARRNSAAAPSRLPSCPSASPNSKCISAEGFDCSARRSSCSAAEGSICCK